LAALFALLLELFAKLLELDAEFAAALALACTS